MKITLTIPHCVLATNKDLWAIAAKQLPKDTDIHTENYINYALNFQVIINCYAVKGVSHTVVINVDTENQTAGQLLDHIMEINGLGKEKITPDTLSLKCLLSILVGRLCAERIMTRELEIKRNTEENVKMLKETMEKYCKCADKSLEDYKNNRTSWGIRLDLPTPRDISKYSIFLLIKNKTKNTVAASILTDEVIQKIADMQYICNSIFDEEPADGKIEVWVFNTHENDVQMLLDSIYRLNFGKRYKSNQTK